MSAGWEDLIARLGGASAHLLGRARLTEAAESRDLAHLAAMLEEAYGPPFIVPAGATAEVMELAIRRAAAGHLRTLSRWSAGRARYLAPVFLDEDRRSLRALLRGAAAGASVHDRLATLVPTPSLPERVLQELASQQSAGGVAALLSAWGHPFGSRLLADAREPHPDLLRLDALVNAEYVARAMSAIRGAPRGDVTRHELLAYVRETADVENASTALQLAGQPASVDAASLFLPEGAHLDRPTFLKAAAAPSVNDARVMLARAFRGSPLATTLQGTDTTDFDDAVLRIRLRRSVQAARQFPLGAAPVLAFVMRLRAEVRDLCLIVWRLAAGAPPLTADELLTVR